ncbi:MAG: histidine phosphatase family protein [Burkholderiales bacterium]|nr:histidine phosphatase family protein [Burkholderiales bacterium]
MRLALIRHPAPAIAAGVCYGASDLLVEEPVLAACIAPLSLALEKMASDAPLYSSPQQRAQVLAQRLALARKVSLIEDERLREMDFGRWEMAAWEQIPRSEIDAWAADVLHYAPGGAETVLQMTQRVLAFLQQLLRVDGGGEAIVVCHAGTIRILKAWQPTLSVEQIALLAAQDVEKIAYGAVVWKELPTFIAG